MKFELKKKWNYAEKCCNLHQITACFELKSEVISVMLRGKVTEIAKLGDRNEDFEAMKCLRTSAESAFSFLFGRGEKC